MNQESNARIRALNDELRVHGRGGTVVITDGIASQGLIFAVQARAAVSNHSKFDDDNDPYNEHDFGTVQLGTDWIFWKIDYYDRAKQYGSSDPSDPAVTSRVLTVMLSHEY